MKSEPAGKRHLALAFLLRGENYVWRCDHCARMFFGDAQETTASTPTARILAEFACHFCAVPEPGASRVPDGFERNAVLLEIMQLEKKERRD